MPYNQLVLKKPRTESDGNRGINDSGIETFKNDPMISLTKEELQNSTDNAINSSEKPVIVEFSVFEYDLKQLPDFESFKEMYFQNYNYWKDYYKQADKAEHFFRVALDIISKEKVRCLRISDFNTTGLTEINEIHKSSGWNNLVKDTGVSDKGEGQGGSFGVGKDASYACSDLRLVFYNTVNVDQEKAFQGVCKLPSYKIGEENFTGWAYFSKDDQIKNRQAPLDENISLDPNFVRQENQFGMDKYIFGFDSRIEDIKDELIISSINNFLVAFIEGRLIVRMNDIEINKDTVDTLIKLYGEDRRLDKATKELYDTYSDPTELKHISLYEDKDVVFAVRFGDNLSGRASIIRQTGMKVFDKKRGLKKNCSYSAAIILEGKTVNKNFKKFENMEHTNWSVIKAPEHRAKHDEMIREFNDFVETLNNSNYNESIDADGVHEYLPMSYIAGNKIRTEILTNIVESTSKIIPPVIKNEPEVEEETIATIDATGEVVIEDHVSGNRPSVHPEPHIIFGHPDPEGEHFGKKLNKNEYKLKMKHNGSYYHVQIKSGRKISNGAIKLSISGETDKVSVNVIELIDSSTGFSFRNNTIIFGSMEADTTQNIKFRLDSSEPWNLEAELYESTK